MQILTGLFPHMVLQCAARGASDAVITGTSSVAGRVIARVIRGKALSVNKLYTWDISCVVANIPPHGRPTRGNSVAKEIHPHPRHDQSRSAIENPQRSSQGFDPTVKRGIEVSHADINRRVYHASPLLVRSEETSGASKTVMDLDAFTMSPM